MSNRLALETSPYLLQHKDNAVDWYPWGSDALTRARAEQKPIFLSIGYAACHWCHVMEHESFDNPEIAAFLNARFICIKVDREERPDLDQIYMTAVQVMTRHGGWPMSVFLTPDLQPFYGGTYWPPYARMGMPGFIQVIQAVDELWRTRRSEAVQQAAQLTQFLQQSGVPEADDVVVGPPLFQEAVGQLAREFDAVHGGFGSKPKFPHAMALQFLLRMWRRTGRDGLLQMVQRNLDKMAHGGIYDHLGGGFARYSVDERWLVPHFEKMLYDNALLAATYLDAYLATGRATYRRVARETLDYVLNYLTDAAGGFHSSEDADSEGEEGKFYVWTPAEIHQRLGRERGARFCDVYDVTEAGNFEGRSILNLPRTIQEYAQLTGRDPDDLQAELDDSRRRLLAARDRRVRPGKDDKVLLSWNALMIEPLARAAAAFDEPRYEDAAVRAAEFILREMQRPDGRLLHTWRGGQAKLAAYLDDYAFLIQALVTLYETQFDERWMEAAVRLADLVLDHFADPQQAGFFYTADDHEQLIARTKDFYESSVPSGNAVAAAALLRLGKLCGRSDYLQAAHGTVTAAAGLMRRAPSAVGQMLAAAEMLLGPLPEIAIVGDPSRGDTAAVLSDLRRRYLPNRTLACRVPGHEGDSGPLAALFQGKSLCGPEPTVYVCENFACQAPVTGRQAAIGLWDRLGRGESV
ncbi:MAG: thioredoxin domain-containing protein [Candidatus Anammoximicrobium sp.]|nr:thioredoxin domain-containing protein [Candidatus Anammoximicrobium sp.]